MKGSLFMEGSSRESNKRVFRISNHLSSLQAISVSQHSEISLSACKVIIIGYIFINLYSNSVRFKPQNMIRHRINYQQHP